MDEELITLTRKALREALDEASGGNLPTELAEDWVDEFANDPIQANVAVDGAKNQEMIAA